MNNSTILIVDDEPINIKLCREMLKPHNYQMITADNGNECITSAKENQPNIILMDWNMPVMDGMEALKILKSDPTTSHIPVIMITGIMVSSESLSLAMNAGATDFLRKPFDKLELNARVKNILLLANSMNILKERNRFIENQNTFISSIIASIPHPIVYYSLDGILLRCNVEFEKLMNIPKDKLLGKSVYISMGIEDAGFHIQKDVELIQNKTTCSYEKCLCEEDRIFIFTKSLMEEGEKPIGIISVLTDISELKKSNERLLSLKKNELISSALQLMHVSEMNNNLINDLLKIIPYANKDGRMLIQQTSNKYRIDMTEQIWVDFEKRFENVFDSFYRVLLEKYPNLTPNERKLAALLRLNLSSKDIAAMTFQNPQSIDVARYRLRKKFDLKTEENLIDFLLKIE
jgi:PAS domain S-box-containing protein